MDTRAIGRFRKNKGAMIGLVIVATILLFSLLGPLFSSQPGNVPDFERGRGPFGTPGAPSSLHWLGTDTIFRDVLARLSEGGRLSLQVAFVATVIAMGIGTAVGVVSGYFKGSRVRVDHLAEALACSTAILAAMSLLIFHAETFGFRLLAFAGWAAVLALSLRAAGRVLAVIRGKARALSVTDLLDSAALIAIVIVVRRGGAQSLGDHRVVTAVVLAALLSLAVRVAWARTHGGYESRDVAFLRVDFDDAVMRVVDVLLSFPFLLLLMAISSAVDRTSQSTIFLVLGLTAWTGNARVIRSKTLQVRELDFIVASRALGQSTPWILVRHVLPNVAGIAIILATNSVATMIVAEAALSFLGLSVPPPAASWGRMLEEGRPYYSVAPWMLIAPALAILLAVLGFNLLGEGLRDVFDPKDV